MHNEPNLLPKMIAARNGIINNNRETNDLGAIGDEFIGTKQS